MDISLRLILVVLGSLVILAIIFDTWYRARKRNNMGFSGASRKKHTGKRNNLFEKNITNYDVKSFSEEPNHTTWREPHLDEQCYQEINLKEEENTPITTLPEEEPIRPAVEFRENKSVPQVFILHVMAERGTLFTGARLLPLFLTLGLKHGEHGIFHRHEAHTGKGEVLFSLASAVKPGIFELERMNNFMTPGLSLFFAVPGVSDPEASFDLMLQTARQLAAHLHGELEDNRHKSLTAEHIAEERMRLHSAIHAMAMSEG